MSTDDDIYWHPNTNIKGIEYYSGSLGHLASVSVGIAIDFKHRNSKQKVYVMLGDGELNEGSNWEAFMNAKSNNLSNLVFIIDRNFCQANVRTEDLIPLEPLREKFEAFGMEVQEIDGHSFDELHQCFNSIDYNNKKPKVIICKTLRGKGLPSIENRLDKWFCVYTKDQKKYLIEELHTGIKNKYLESPKIQPR